MREGQPAREQTFGKFTWIAPLTEPNVTGSHRGVIAMIHPEAFEVGLKGAKGA